MNTEITAKIQKIANAYARKNGHSIATEIRFEEIDAPKIVSVTHYGYRKYTTGDYVSGAYRRKFGWKNTYYQCAECVVALPVNLKPS
jgi:hypothetical protein